MSDHQEQALDVADKGGGGDGTTTLPIAGERRPAGLSVEEATTSESELGTPTKEDTMKDDGDLQLLTPRTDHSIDDTSLESPGNAPDSSEDGLEEKKDDDNVQKKDASNMSCGEKWSAMIQHIRLWVTRGMQFITYFSAHWPRITVLSVSALSLGLLIAGYLTNFQLELDNHDLWPPKDSISQEHFHWYIGDAHFNYDPVEMNIYIHKNGDNVLGKEGVERIFEVIDLISDMEGYKEGCEFAEQYGDSYWVGQCHIVSVADFWNESQAIFEDTVQTDQDAIRYMSQDVYPNGILVDTKRLFGNVKYENTTTTATSDSRLLVSAETYLLRFDFPWSNQALEFEENALDLILEKARQWDQDPNNSFQLEVRSLSSYSNEFLRAIRLDLFLIPIAFVVMCGFTLLVFAKCHRVQSRGLLGIGAVLCTVVSVMTAYGIMFLIGVPFTTQTTMLPFLMFGIGLDDAFIIFGSFNRKDPSMSPVDRVQSTIEDIGMSIFLTSITSALAFGLGALSAIPAVSWLCLYAFPAIVIVFFYQITFFVALLVLDQQRMDANRMDWCTCIRVKQTTTKDDTETHRQQSRPEENQEQTTTDNEAETNGSSNTVIDTVAKDFEEDRNEETDYIKSHPADRFMSWFATKLLKPKVQLVVIGLFFFVLGGSIYNATQLHQEFDFTELVPRDSYLKRWFNVWENYSTVGLYTFAIFRDVDQSDPAIQEQMEKYVSDLYTEGPADEPVYFWLTDFKAFMNDSSNQNLTQLSFDDQVAAFLDVPINFELYKGDIGRPSGGGKVYESRVQLHINVDLTDSRDATDMLATLRDISDAQEVNQGPDDWRFFTYDHEYHIYEFYKKVIEELIFTTVMGVIAVGIIALLFIPHWTAMPVTLVFISFLYIEMLGFLYMTDVQINAISYVTLVMSIGLMVDYIMHILLRYFEAHGTRADRVKETLSTLGSSMLLGAISTFLGVLCLAFSSSEILQSVFVAVMGLVSLGVLNGLVFLPVALALFGPE